MIRHIINRPIGTSVIALTLVMLGLILGRFIPISLLPDLPVPEITVRVMFPNADAKQVQQIVTHPIKNQLVQVNNLDDLDAVSYEGVAVIKLRFNHGTDIDAAYLEVNELIDRLLDQLPKDVSRPTVIKAGAGDLPVFQLNVWPKNERVSFTELSSFCENVLKRRLEQLEEVAFVDVTGLTRSRIVVKPNLLALHHIGIAVNDLATLIKSQVGELGNVTIREGNYEYSVGFEAVIKSSADIENLHLSIPLPTGNRIIRLGELATVQLEEEPLAGMYAFNGQRAIGLSINKDHQAQLLRFRERMNDLVQEFEQEYPNMGFKISQDQSELLDLSIDNLVSSLLIGAILSFFMILFFMKEKRIVLLIGLVIPISITITFLGFYLLGLSINIISLAGLVLGVGEIIDSAIIITENIEQKLEEGDTNLEDACVNGAEQVIKPLFVSVLTNSLVFIPLLFLDGLAGTLFFDQAVAVSLALGVSLFTSYTLVPVAYFQLFKNNSRKQLNPTLATRLSERVYNTVFYFAFQRPKILFLLWILLLGGGLWVVSEIKMEGLPPISRTEMDVKVNWNEPVTVEENERRVSALMGTIKEQPTEVGMYIGTQQFLLNQQIQQTSTEALLKIKVKSTAEFDRLAQAIQKQSLLTYSNAKIEVSAALNLFEQLFRTSEVPLRIDIRDHANELSIPSSAQIDSISKRLKQEGIQVQSPPMEASIQLHIQRDKLLIYGIQQSDLIQLLRLRLGEENIGQLRSNDHYSPIYLSDQTTVSSIDHWLSSTLVPTQNGALVTANELVKYSTENEYATLYMSKNGAYLPLSVLESKGAIPKQILEIKRVMEHFPAVAFGFSGSYFRNLSYINNLSNVIWIALAMLFFILAAQFESLLQPFIVLLTIVFGMIGAIICLYITGNSINVMSAIGLVVLMGLLDNDSILKIDTMNRAGEELSLMEVIRSGGLKRLQSQLMTFLTTVLGLLPVLWASGLGAELQKPLAVAVIGGMCVGVLISWTFIPLMYYWMSQRKNK